MPIQGGTKNPRLQIGKKKIKSFYCNLFIAVFAEWTNYPIPNRPSIDEEWECGSLERDDVTFISLVGKSLVRRSEKRWKSPNGEESDGALPSRWRWQMWLEKGAWGIQRGNLSSRKDPGAQGCRIIGTPCDTFFFFIFFSYTRRSRKVFYANVERGPRNNTVSLSTATERSPPYRALVGVPK